MPSLPCIRLSSVILIAALCATAGDASAQRGARTTSAAGPNPVQQDRGAQTMAQQHRHDRTADQRALSAAVRRVESQTGGQVLSAERVPFDGRDVSRIKVVDSDGRVRVYMDDPVGPRDRRLRSQGVVPTRDDDN